MKIYKKICVVPMCLNTSFETPDKIFFPVPRDPKMIKLWGKAMRRELIFRPKCTRLICEDHFSFEKDLKNYMQFHIMGRDKVKKLHLKPGVVPHLFACQDRNSYQPVKEGSAVPTRERSILVADALACQNRNSYQPVKERSAVSAREHSDLGADALTCQNQNSNKPLKERSALWTKEHSILVVDAFNYEMYRAAQKKKKDEQENPNLYQRIVNSLQGTLESQTNSNPTTESSFATQISIKQEIDDDIQVTPELQPTLNTTHDGQVSIKQENEQNSIQGTSESPNIPYPTLEYVPETPSSPNPNLECLPESQNIPYPNLEYVPESQNISHPTLECVPETQSSPYSNLDYIPEVQFTIKEENEYMDIETTPESDTNQDPTLESTPSTQTFVTVNISNDIQSASETNSCPTSKKIQVMPLSDKQKSKIFEELFIRTNRNKISLEKGNLILHAKLKEEIKKNTAFRIKSNQKRIVLEHDIRILQEKLQQEAKKMNDLIIKSNQREIILEHDIMFLKGKLEEERKNINALQSVFSEDQLKILRSDSASPKHWSESTVQTALSLRRSCGLTGYQALLDLGLPFPDINTLQVAHAEKDYSLVFLSRLTHSSNR